MPFMKTSLGGRNQSNPIPPTTKISSVPHSWDRSEFVNFCFLFSAIFPTKIAAKKKPTKYPTDGLENTSIPEEKSEKTGKPITPKKK